MRDHFCDPDLLRDFLPTYLWESKIENMTKKKYHRGDLMSECVQMNLRSLGENAKMGNTIVTIWGGYFFSSIVRSNSCHSLAKQFKSSTELLNLVWPKLVFCLH